ncbi:MAG TPA: hypothetical protein DCL38_05915 [Lachnospiraceae bacterium]|nr:hypothetical protein [Lachnospiraceae bacterium]
MDKVIYLHIGTTKTGTSSIQNFLYLNRSFLAKKGYCFKRLPIICYEHYDRNRNGMFIGGHRRLAIIGQVPIKIRDRILEFGLKQVEKQLKHFSTVILTDESLWGFFQKTGYKNLKRIKAFADDNNALLKLIVYLRPQEDWIESIYRQSIKQCKSGKNRPEWGEFISHPEQWPKTDYYEGLRHLSDIVGKENIIVRIYDRKEFMGGKAENDFLQAIGLDPSEGYVIPNEEKNTSISPNYIEIKRILNQLEGVGNITHNDLIYGQLATEACSRNLRKSSRETFMNAQERAMIRKLYEDGNQKIIKEYLKDDRKELFPAPKEAPVWNKDNPDLYEDTVLMLGYMLLEQEIEITKLKRTVYLRLKIYDKCKAVFDKLIQHIVGGTA